MRNLAAGKISKFLILIVVTFSVPAISTAEVAKQDGGNTQSQTISEKNKQSLVDHLSGSVWSNFKSKYMSHGVADSAGWVWQPSATIEFYGLGFNLWGNMPMDNEPARGSFNEIDLTLYYDLKIYGFTIHPYFVADIYPVDNPNSLDYSSTADIMPSIYLAYTYGPLSIFTDIEVYVYPKPAGALRGQVGLSLNQPLPKNFGIETSATLGFSNWLYNSAHFKIPETAITYFQYDLAISWKPWRGFVIKPNGHISTFIPKKFRDDAPNVATPVVVWGGVDLGYNF